MYVYVLAPSNFQNFGTHGNAANKIHRTSKAYEFASITDSQNVSARNMGDSTQRCTNNTNLNSNYEIERNPFRPNKYMKNNTTC